MVVLVARMEVVAVHCWEDRRRWRRSGQLVVLVTRMEAVAVRRWEDRRRWIRSGGQTWSRICVGTLVISELGRDSWFFNDGRDLDRMRSLKGGTKKGRERGNYMQIYINVISQLRS